MSEEIIAEVQGPLVFRIIYDKELGYLFANIPINKKISSSALREIMTITNDPWRYLDGMGLVLDISAWAQESEIDVQAIGKALEAKYKEILPAIKEVVDKAKESVKKKKKSRKRKRKKASKRRRRSKKSK